MASLDSLDASLAPVATFFVGLVRDYWPDATVTDAYRSRKRQADDYRRFLEGRSRYPAAPPGRSLHEYGLAFDLDIPSDRGALREVGAAWESLGPGFRWGGNFKHPRPDPIHFEFLPSPDPRTTGA